MKLSSRHTPISVALLAYLAPLAVSSIGCSVNALPLLPSAAADTDGGPGPGSSDAGPQPASDAAPPVSDGSAPPLDPALLGTWQTNNTADGLGQGGTYSSFSLNAVFDASGTLAISTAGVQAPGSLLAGCTQKYAASGSYTVQGSSLVSSAVATGTDTLGTVNRTGCTDPTNNVTDGTMTDTVRGSLFNSVAGPYVVSGSTLTITTSTGVVLTYTKQ